MPALPLRIKDEMGVSTNGQICFGVLLDENVELPWDKDNDGDFEAWWMCIQGYQPPFEIYDETGNYINGARPPEEYYTHRHAFEKAHPLPFTLVNYCSGDDPMYILAIVSSEKGASRGYPESFNPVDLNVDQDEIDKLVQFCTDYGIEYDGEPGWWLSSYWG